MNVERGKSQVLLQLRHLVLDVFLLNNMLFKVMLFFPLKGFSSEVTYE